MGLEDRRKQRRVRSCMTTKIYNQSGKLLARGQIENICENGLCFFADTEFAIGSPVIFEYKIGGLASPLKIISKIVWEKKINNAFMHGAKFEKVGFWQRLRIKRYIKMCLNVVRKPLIKRSVDQRSRIS